MARRKPADTPLMRQFLQVKAEHPDAILFFRLGDFYEMFFEDAVLTAGLLDLALTSRDKGREDAVPMCGVPHHAARGYIAKLTELGHKVVLCEQVEDPRQAKGLVRREVVRIVTPGIVLDDEILEPKAARYVAAVVETRAGADYGLALLDVSTGEFRVTGLDTLDEVAAELARAEPREVLVGEASTVAAELGARYRAVYSPVALLDKAAARAELDKVLGEPVAGELGHALVQAAAAAVTYARRTQPAGALPLSRLQVYHQGDAVVLDEAAIVNLELCRTLIEGKKEGSLLSVIDATCTAPGGRALRRWLLYPLTEVAPIRRRHDAVEHLVERAALRLEARQALRRIHDLERIAGRISLGVATPRDLDQLRASLARVPELVRLVAGQGEVLAVEVPELLRAEPALVAELEDVAALLDETLADEPPAALKDGGVIRDGYCELIDEHRRLADGGRDAIEAIEARERDRTGISSLRIKYNRVFGYYLEVTRSQLGRVPDDYVRKQTIATGERYVTGELADLEAKIVAAQETLAQREAELFRQLAAKVGEHLAALKRAAELVAVIDVCAGLAEVAAASRYVRPTVDDGETIVIEEGRHPVVERMVPEGSFVPNDCRLDPRDDQLVLITGPNMAGKSTFMRQVAQIVLLAQMGSFVPASAARIGLVDRIFTRVGAADNLARGESTFMVEMRETSAILAGATRRSLVVLDEVGRGTSTFDGVSIAWAVSEYLHDAIGARTLFATHYHELCALAQFRPRVRNLSVAVSEHDGEVVFLRRVVEGGASRSYGIDVARLAGLPRSVVARARQILGQLESGQAFGTSSQLSLFTVAAAAPPIAEPAPAGPEPFAEPDPAAAEVLDRLRGLEPDQTTPLEALTLLAALKRLASS
jgi:DNA mismatch repair protein MutS